MSYIQKYIEKKYSVALERRSMLDKTTEQLIIGWVAWGTDDCLFGDSANMLAIGKTLGEINYQLSTLPSYIESALNMNKSL
jgi:hypothetical protein